MYIGIDPGITGAVVILDHFSNYITGWNHELKGRYKKKNKTDNVIDFELIPIIDNGAKVVIEKPHTRMGEGGAETSWRNYQTLWLGYRPHFEVLPRKWKKYLDIPAKLSKVEASHYQLKRFCPVVDVNNEKIDWYAKTPKGNRSSRLNDGLIDAYCIALYLYRTQNFSQ